MTTIVVSLGHTCGSNLCTWCHTWHCLSVCLSCMWCHTWHCLSVCLYVIL